MNERLAAEQLLAATGPVPDEPPRDKSPLRLMIVTEDEPFHLAETFEKLFAVSPRWLDIVGVAVLAFAPVGIRGSRLTLLRALGTRYGMSNLLRAAAVVVGNRLRPRRRLGTVLRQSGVAATGFHKLDGEAFAAEMARLDPDVVVTIAFNRIVPPVVLAESRAIWMNVHLGLLPHNRGPAPVFWALHDGEHESGVTVHLTADEVDGGAILAQRRRAIDERRLAVEHRALRLLSVDVLIDALTGLRKGVAPSRNSDLAARWRGVPETSHIAAFLARGNRFF